MADSGEVYLPNSWPLFQKHEHQQRPARPRLHQDVRGPGAAHHGRGRADQDVLRVRQSSPDQRSQRQSHRQK